MPRSSQLDPFRPSLALWITLGTLGSAMSMLVLLLILINNFSATYARQRAITEVSLMADNVIDTLKWRQEERIRDLSLLASWPNFRQQTTAEQRETLTTMVEKTSSFHWLSLLIHLYLHQKLLHHLDLLINANPFQFPDVYVFRLLHY